MVGAMTEPSPTADPTPPEDGAGAVAEDRMVWIDLEMTGLRVETDRIVEIAVLVTDSALTILDEAGYDVVIHQPPDALADLDDVVRKMHTKSGLLDAIAASEVDEATALAGALEYVQRFVPAPRAAPLCGNTIGMDRRFLARYAPELDAYLHYRSVDVSSLKELARRWYPAIYRKRPDKSESHRALDDIRESIAELAYYRDTLFANAGTADGSSQATPGRST